MTHLGWVSEIPHGWAARPLRALAEYWVSNVDKIPSSDETPVRLCNYSDVYKNEFVTLDLNFMLGTATDEEIRKFRLAVGDVVITKDSENWEDIGVPALVTESADDLVCGYHLAILRPKPGRILGRFLFRCLQAKPVRVQFELAASDGVTRFGVPKSEIGGAWLPVPPRENQEAIADYLDRETARLDALIAAKERQLGFLTEKKQSSITRAVTRGLDPACPLRDSGIPWLGAIPAHWGTKRGKWIFRQSALPVREDDEIVTCFRDGQVTLRRNRREDGFMVAEKEVGYQGIRQGQLVLHSMDAFAGAVGVSDSEGKCSPEYIICKPRESEFDSHYYGYLLRWMALAGFIQASCPAVRERAPRIRFNDLAEMLMPIPPVEEQKAIVITIREGSDNIGKTIHETERTIALLKERRSALIAAAVTGQIDVGSRA